MGFVSDMYRGRRATSWGGSVNASEAERRAERDETVAPRKPPKPGIVILRENAPTRCEICHQADCFDPETGECARCMPVVGGLPLAGPASGPVERGAYFRRLNDHYRAAETASEAAVTAVPAAGIWLGTCVSVGVLVAWLLIALQGAFWQDFSSEVGFGMTVGGVCCGLAFGIVILKMFPEFERRLEEFLLAWFGG